MENKMDNLLDIVGQNKKLAIIMVIIYILVILILIVFIWWPKEKQYATYTPVDIEQKKEELSQWYINNIGFMFMGENKDEVKDLISNEYVNYTKKTKEEIVTELDEAGFFSIFTSARGMELYEDGDTYVYTTTIFNKDKSRKINIVETSPYNYTIALDDFYKYNEDVDSITAGNIEFNIKSIYRNLKYIEVEFEIQNNNNTYARFNFHDLSGVQAVLEDDKKYSAANLVSAEQYTEIPSNGIINKTFVFEIPVQLQEGIDYILFQDVRINFETSNLKIDI